MLLIVLLLIAQVLAAAGWLALAGSSLFVIFTVMLLDVGKLVGMNENSTTVSLPASCQQIETICGRVYEVANVLLVTSSEPDSLLFAARTAANGSDVLVAVKLNNDRALLKVNCDMIVIGQMLLKELKLVLTRI